jgi:hypothetical protein
MPVVVLKGDADFTKPTPDTTRVQVVNGKTVRLHDFELTGANVLLDYGQDLALTVENVTISGLNGGVPIHNRYRPWRYATFRHLHLHDLTNADGIHVAGGNHVVGPTLLEDVTIENVRDGTSHPDAIQVPCGSQNWTVRGLTVRNAPALCMIMPQQVGYDPVTGQSGTSTGAGEHVGMIWNSVVGENAGTARFYCCPRLVLSDWVLDDRTTLDLRRLQPAAGGTMPAGATPESGTRDVLMLNCVVPVLMVGGDNPATAGIQGPVTFDPGSGGNRIGRIIGTQAGEERAIRAVLERPLAPPVPPSPPSPPEPPEPPVDWEARARAAETDRDRLADQLRRIAAITTE